MTRLCKRYRSAGTMVFRQNIVSAAIDCVPEGMPSASPVEEAEEGDYVLELDCNTAVFARTFIPTIKLVSLSRNQQRNMC